MEAGGTGDGVREVAVDERDQLSLPDPAHTAVARLSVRLGRLGAEGVPAALELLIEGLGLTSAAVRDAAGALVAQAGAAQLVDAAATPVLELPLGGASPGTLTAVGAAAEHLPLLRVSAAVIGLALAVPPPRAPAPVEEMVLLADQDRDDLADALHDGPVQQLVFARYAADAAVRGGSAVEARDAVQGALVALRRTIWHLRPRGGNLPAALDELSLRLAEGGLRMLAVNVQAGGDALSPAGAALAYRLVQAVALAGRPTAAGTDPLAVTLRPQGDEVLLSLPAQPFPALRADRWDRRARALGGRLDAGLSGLTLHLPAHPCPDPKATP